MKESQDNNMGGGRGGDEGESSFSKPKITDQETYDKELKRKKSEWRQFMKFLKKNPEAILGIAEQ